MNKKYTVKVFDEEGGEILNVKAVDLEMESSKNPTPLRGIAGEIIGYQPCYANYSFTFREFIPVEFLEKEGKESNLSTDK